jgi:hypothetical protein
MSIIRGINKLTGNKYNTGIEYNTGNEYKTGYEYNMENECTDGVVG